MAETGTLLVGTSFIFLCVQVALGTPTTPPSVEIGIIDGPGHEGNDILFTPEQQAMLDLRKAVNILAKRWTEVGGIPNVPFRFADGLVNQTLVRPAIAHWEEHTCLVFPEVAADYAGDHLYFQRHASSCNSYVGMVGNGGQPINVPVWCENAFGSLVHEIGHAIGFFHEQSRSDRDTYVKINNNNTDPAASVNFLLANDNNHSVPYDFNSDMHYYERAFSINGHITIATVNPLYQGVIGQRGGLSHMDKLLANRMYSCIDKNLVSCSLASDPCQNYGYLGKNCNCVCPQGTSGTNCETLTTPYNDVNLSAYTETITTETTITSPNYPGITPGAEKYTKWIQAPDCKLVQLNFSDFSTYGRLNSNGLSICKYEGLEIRTDSMFDGTWYCGTEISTGQLITSTRNEMIVFFLTYFQNWSNAKWSADVTFVDDPSCSMSSTSTTSATSSSTTHTTSTTSAPTTTSTTTTSTSTTPPITSTSTSTTSTSTSTTSTTSTTPLPTTTSTSTTSTTSTTPLPTTTSTSTTTSTTPLPTTTSTSTTSTTSTTPPPTTTSTSTTPPTTTTSTTTTTIAVPECPNTKFVGHLTRVTSPNYPRSYPNNAMCRYEHLEQQEEPEFAILIFYKFKLNTGDKLSIDHPYGPSYVLKGSRRRSFTMKVPAQFRATFTSDDQDTKRGFSMYFIEFKSQCHKSLDATTPGVITTPHYPGKHWKKVICEWKITASPGMRVRVTIKIKSVKCGKNYVSVNTSPMTTPFYDPSVVKRFCGKRMTEVVTSQSNVISVFYWGKKIDKGFRLNYEEVP